MDRTKPFPISKRQVWEAWKKVKANKGGAGIDGQTIEAFEARNLSTILRHRRFLFTDSLLLLWK